MSRSYRMLFKPIRDISFEMVGLDTDFVLRFGSVDVVGGATWWHEYGHRCVTKQRASPNVMESTTAQLQRMRLIRLLLKWNQNEGWCCVGWFGGVSFGDIWVPAHVAEINYDEHQTELFVVLEECVVGQILALFTWLCKSDGSRGESDQRVLCKQKALSKWILCFFDVNLCFFLAT